jgi:hypothetical protein
MTSAILTLTAKAYDAGLTDLTSMTGPDADGYTGADWLYFNAAGTQWTNPEARFRKTQGARQINPAFVIAGANPSPTVSNSPASFAHTFTRTLGDGIGGTIIGTGGLNVAVSSSELGNGIGVTFPLTRDLKTLWWLGWVRNATCQAVAAMSDGEVIVSDLALPVGGFNVYQPAWYECTFRGNYQQVQNGETVTISTIRTGGATASGQIHARAYVLLPDVAPYRPRGI